MPPETRRLDYLNSAFFSRSLHMKPVANLERVPTVRTAEHLEDAEY